MTDEERLIKNATIKENGAATRLRRKQRVCKTFRFKVDRSSLSQAQKESIKMYFVEAKRLYNYIIGSKQGEIFNLDYKDFKHITYFDKDKNLIEYDIKYIGSSVLQDIIRTMKESIVALSRSKQKGNKVGALKFKSECNSVRFVQYGITHKIKGSKFKIQGIKKPIRVNGLKQLEKYPNIEYTTATMTYDGYDYFINLTCFVDKPVIDDSYKQDIIGIDLGCSSTITLSNGQKMKVLVEESERLKGLQARLARQQKRSNNWYKTRSLIRKEYNRISNQKQDAVHKIVHDLTSTYKTIVTQDDRIDEWHQDKKHSKTVQHSILGGIKVQLKRYDGSVFLDQWFPTTKHCFECGSNINMPPEKRTFRCPVCGFTADRDVHAANNMIEYYNRYLQSAGTVDLTPRSKITYKEYMSCFMDRKPISL